MDCLRKAHDTNIATLSQRRGRCKVFGTVGVAVVHVSFRHSIVFMRTDSGILSVASSWCLLGHARVCKPCVVVPLATMSGQQDARTRRDFVSMSGSTGPRDVGAELHPAVSKKNPTADDSTLGLFEGKLTAC